MIEVCVYFNANGSSWDFECEHYELKDGFLILNKVTYAARTHESIIIPQSFSYATINNLKVATKEVKPK